MDREKAIDRIYGEQLLQPIGAEPPSEKRTLSEEEQRRGPPLDVMSGFAEELVNRLFSVGLSLERARSIVGDGPAGDRIAAATGELDRMISDIRAMLHCRSNRLTSPGSQRGWTIPRRSSGGPTEIKRWRAFADQARQMARRWEQQP